MILKRFHKWFFNLALIVSVVSFNGFTNNTENIARINTELVVTKKPISRVASYFFQAKNATSNIYTPISFNSFVINYNLRAQIAYEITIKKTLQYLNHLHFKMVSHTYNQSYKVLPS